MLVTPLGPTLVFMSGCNPGEDNEANLCYPKAQDIGDPNTWLECHGFLCTQSLTS